LARLVIERRTFLDRSDKPCRVQRFYRSDGREFLREIEDITPIAVRHGAQTGSGIVGQWQLLAIMRLGALEQRFKRGIIEPAQHEDLRAREQRAVQLEGWIFRRRANQNDRPVFDDGQKGILLTAVEAMNLVDEEQSPLPHATTLARGVEGLLEVGHAGKDR